MAKKTGNYEIPFNRKGDLLHYPENEYEGQYPNYRTIPPIWRDNFQFTDTLKVAGMSRGRSAAYFILVSETDGRRYPIFMKEMHELISMSTLVKGVVKATWTFVKRGQNYGLSLVN